MAGYTQTELQAIFSASGVGSDYSQRRLADIIIKAYIDIGVIRAVEATGGAGAPLYNYNTRKYFVSMSRPLIELATACYGQNYTAAQITALAKTEAFGPLSGSFATYVPNIVQATFACMELGAESIAQGDFVAHTYWTVANGLLDTGGNLAYTHNAGANTATQTAADRTTDGKATLVNSAWYVFDFEVITAPTNIAHLTSYQLGIGVCSEATNILPITATDWVAGKKSFIFKSATAADVANFVLTVVSSNTGANNVIDNFSLKQITNSSYSTNPLSNFSSTQALYGFSGSNYCKKFIAVVVTNTLQKIAEGEYSVYGTRNKQAEPNLEYYTT
jgi:hypothetical protein